MTTTAASEYKRLQGECRVLLKTLTETLNAHEKRQAEWPTHWSFTGDVRKARRDMLELAAFLGCEQSREVLQSEAVDR